MGRIAAGFDQRELFPSYGARPGLPSGLLLLRLVGQEAQHIVAHFRPMTIDSVKFVDIGAVDSENSIIKAERHHHDICPLDQDGEKVPLARPARNQGLELIAGTLHHHPGLDDVLDVRAGAVPPRHLAISVAFRLTPREHPAIIA